MRMAAAVQRLAKMLAAGVTPIAADLKALAARSRSAVAGEFPVWDSPASWRWCPSPSPEVVGLRLGCRIAGFFI
jgi:hypothetical protein